MKRLVLLSTIFIMALFIASTGFSSTQTELNVHQLTDKITTVEKQKVTLTGTIAGACVSGCKIWLTDGPYKKGDPVVLVWAKDNAFKFKTDVAGQKVNLEGFAVGKYIDLCASQKKQEGVVEEGENCKKPESLHSADDKKLESITFFATDVSYL